MAIADAGGFTKAACQLHVSQSALSLHVRQMEDAFGVPLLIRERTGVRPTTQGAKLLRHARLILQQVALAEADLTSKISSPTGEVTIGIPSGAARVMLAELLAAAENILPNVSLKIIEGMTGPLEEWMSAGRFNLAVLYRTTGALGRNVELAHEEFCLVAHPDKPPFDIEIKLSDLHAFPLSLPREVNNARRMVSDAVSRLGYMLDIRFEVDSLSAIIKMIEDGRAYSILTPSAIQSEVKSGRLKAIKIVDPIITRAIVLATNVRDERNPAVEATKKVLVDVVRQLILTGSWPANLAI